MGLMNMMGCLIREGVFYDTLFLHTIDFDGHGVGKMDVAYMLGLIDGW